MTIVLNEAAADGVAAAAAALVEAARASPAAYTPAELQEILGEAVALSEGVLDWIRKKVTGIDPDLFAEIEAKFAHGLTPQEKERSMQRLSRAIVKATARMEKVDGLKRAHAHNYASEKEAEEDGMLSQRELDAWKKEASDHIAKAKALKAKLARAP